MGKVNKLSQARQQFAHRSYFALRNYRESPRHTSTKCTQMCLLELFSMNKSKLVVIIKQNRVLTKTNHQLALEPHG